MPIVEGFNCAFARSNPVSLPTTTITADSEEPLMPASNLGNPDVTEVYRSQSHDFTVTIDFGEDIDADFLLLRVPRRATVLCPAADDEIQHWLDEDGGSPGYGDVYDSGMIDLGMLPHLRYHVLMLPETMTFRWWTFRIVAASLEDIGYVDLGVAFTQTIWQPEGNFSLQINENILIGSSVNRNTNTQNRRTDPGDRVRELVLPFSYLSEEDKQWFEVLAFEDFKDNQIVFFKQWEGGDLARDTILGIVDDDFRTQGVLTDVSSFTIRIVED